MRDFFISLGAWNWLVLAVVLFVLETMVPGVHFIWFGLSAAAIGVLALLVDISWEWQLIAFAILSCATVFFVRRYSGPDVAATDEPDLNIRAHQYIGRIVTVDEPINAGRGKVRVGDTVWAAQGSDAPKGARVKIIGTSGTVLVVENAGT